MRRPWHRRVFLLKLCPSDCTNCSATGWLPLLLGGSHHSAPGNEGFSSIREGGHLLSLQTPYSWILSTAAVFWEVQPADGRKAALV